MKADIIYETLFKTPWQRCHIHLSSGDVLDIDHPDWAFMSPTRTFLIIVLANDSYHVVELDHIVSLDIERLPRRSSRKRQAA